MNIVDIKQIKLIGLALKTKTSNSHGQSSIDCENLWHEFHKQKYADIIPNKLSAEIFGVYHNYEGDSAKPFSYFIGYKVSPDSVIPPGLQSLKIPAGKYQKFIAKGIMPECVTNVWKEIWTSNYSRTYQIDFEVYDERSKDWNNAEVDVYLSIVN
jgi:predicted transcriptional regulator YdeE